MSRRDVDLIVRAKDQAGKVLDSVTAAINEFTKSQTGLEAKAKKTDSALGQLGDAFTRIQRATGSLDISRKLTADLDKAKASVDNLRDSFRKTESEVARLGAAEATATANTERLAQSLRDAAAAQASLAEKTRAARDAARAEQQSLNKAVALKERVAAADDRLARSLTARRAQLAAAIGRQQQYESELSKTNEVTASQQARLDSLQNSVARHLTAVARLTAEYRQNRESILSTKNAVASLENSAAQAVVRLQASETALAGAAANTQQLTEASRAAAQAQKAASDAADKARAALDKEADALKRAETGMRELTEAQSRAGAAAQELTAKLDSGLRASLQAQRRAMLETKREWVAQTDAVKKYAQEIRAAETPSQEIVDKFTQAKNAAAAAKQEYTLQRGVLAQLTAEYRNAGTSVDGLRNAQSTFAAVQAQSAAALSAARQNTSAAVSATKEHANVTADAASKTNGLSSAFQSLYGESRKSMSVLQRLRGEVLSLVTAYVGLFAAVNALTKVVDATQTLEAAQSRLNVAFDGDKGRASQEMDFLRQNANRLGIQFGQLAQEYSKFAIATKGTNLEGEATRKIFISIAEAARVNKSSFAEMQGIFTAVTQIVSKGAVQMEELRQQLGDRLPGAIQLMADAVGVSTAELIKMMEAGKVTSDALLPFAEQLDKKFGPGLQDALKGTTTALGRFQNAIFNTAVEFGRAGFIDSFTKLLDSLSKSLQSDAFRSFATSISSAMGSLLGGIRLLAENFRAFIVVLSAFVGLKVSGLFIEMTRSIVGAVAAFHAARTAAAAAAVATVSGAAASTAAVAATTTAAGAATAAFTALGVAIRGALFSPTTWVVGIVAIAASVGLWATRTGEATLALREHEKQIERVKTEYEKADIANKGFVDRIKGLEVSQATRSLLRLQNQLARERRSVREFIGSFGPGQADTTADLNALNDALRSGTLSADNYKKALEALRVVRGLSPEFVADLQDAAGKIGDLETAVARQKAAIALLNGTATQADKALLGLDKTQERAAASARNQANDAKNLEEAIKKIGDAVKPVESGLKGLNNTDLEDAFQAALKIAKTWQDAEKAVTAYSEAVARNRQQAVDKAYGDSTDGKALSAELIRRREGFRATPYTDNDGRLRIGFGSDQITLADGTIQKVVQGMRVSVADANRDLVRRIDAFQEVIRRQIGADTFNAMTPQQQAALTSIAYNYGSLPGRIIEAIKSGNKELGAKAIEGLAGDNKGINRERRYQEAALFRSTASTEALALEQEKAAKKAREEAEKKKKAAEEYHKELKTTLDTEREDRDLAQAKLIVREQTKAIREAEAEAQKKGTALTKEEREAILANTAEKFRAKQAEEERAAVLKKATDAEKEYNQLLSRRDSLLEQKTLFSNAGNSEKEKELTNTIAELNKELGKAIERSIAMWQAVGGPQADAAIAKLQLAKLNLDGVGATASGVKIEWKKVQDLFVNGLTDAVGNFVKAVVEGKNAGEAARQAFLQFASEFLREIAKMIIKQIILNALKSAMNFAGIPLPTGHTGGVVGSKAIGSGNARRTINPASMMFAQRHHSGGLPGLRPNEVPAILLKGEEVLSRSDPRNILNGGAAPGAAPASPANIRIINAIDSGDMVSQGLNSVPGERAILNFMRSNAGIINSILGNGR